MSVTTWMETDPIAGAVTSMDVICEHHCSGCQGCSVVLLQFGGVYFHQYMTTVDLKVDGWSLCNVHAICSVHR